MLVICGPSQGLPAQQRYSHYSVKMYLLWKLLSIYSGLAFGATVSTQATPTALSNSDGVANLLNVQVWSSLATFIQFNDELDKYKDENAVVSDSYICARIQRAFESVADQARPDLFPTVISTCARGSDRPTVAALRDQFILETCTTLGLKFAQGVAAAYGDIWLFSDHLEGDVDALDATISRHFELEHLNTRLYGLINYQTSSRCTTGFTTCVSDSPSMHCSARLAMSSPKVAGRKLESLLDYTICN